MTFITDLMQQRIEAGHARMADFRGCTEEEITQLEERLGLVVPELFKDYLRCMGWEPGGVAPESDFRFGCLHLLTCELRQCGAEQGVEFPNSIFAVFAHQGYDYLYMELDSKLSDPPVHRYHIDYDCPELVFATLSEYLTWLVQGGGVIPMGLRRAALLRAALAKRSNARPVQPESELGMMSNYDLPEDDKQT